MTHKYESCEICLASSRFVTLMGEVLLGGRKQSINQLSWLLKMIDKEVIICKEDSDILHSEVKRYT